jgi:hypothetical protein
MVQRHGLLEHLRPAILPAPFTYHPPILPSAGPVSQDLRHSVCGGEVCGSSLRLSFPARGSRQRRPFNSRKRHVRGLASALTQDQWFDHDGSYRGLQSSIGRKNSCVLMTHLRCRCSVIVSMWEKLEDVTSERPHCRRLQGLKVGVNARESCAEAFVGGTSA